MKKKGREVILAFFHEVNHILIVLRKKKKISESISPANSKERETEMVYIYPDQLYLRGKCAGP